MLIVEHNLMESVVSTIGDIISPLYDTSECPAHYHMLLINVSIVSYVDKECLNLHTKEYKHDRIVFLLYDLR